MLDTRMKSPIGHELSTEKFDMRGASGNSFTIPRSMYRVLKRRLIRTSLRISCHTAREESVRKSFTLMGKRNFGVRSFIPHDYNLVLEDRTLDCLWITRHESQSYFFLKSPFNTILVNQTNPCMCTTVIDVSWKIASRTGNLLTCLASASLFTTIEGTMHSARSTGCGSTAVTKRSCDIRSSETEPNPSLNTTYVDRRTIRLTAR